MLRESAATEPGAIQALSQSWAGGDTNGTLARGSQCTRVIKIMVAMSATDVFMMCTYYTTVPCHTIRTIPISLCR